MSDLLEAFMKNVNALSCGESVSFTCRLGLWSVTARDTKTAFREAMHYFQQYHADGEYDGTAAEKLLGQLKGPQAQE